MKQKLVLVVMAFWSMSIFAGGDIVDNGGGVWSCGDKISSSSEVFLVDFYEAETEWQWQLKNYQKSTYQAILEDVKEDMDREFPGYSRDWKSRMDSVQQKMNFVEADLEIIDDSLYRSRPKEELCVGKTWEYLQLANYTGFGIILVQKDIWESPLMSPLERAGLIVHEAIYEWFRDQYKDKNSIRSRILVGLIFAHLDKETKGQKLRKLLGHSEPPPPPTEEGWICAHNSNMTLRFYLGFAKTKELSQTLAAKSCNENDEFPEHCVQFPYPCEKTNSPENKWVCTQRHALTDQIFVQQGRTRLEAMVHTHNSCVDDDPSSAVHCEEPQCERL